jgi:hypothetical protein
MMILNFGDMQAIIIHEELAEKIRREEAKAARRQVKIIKMLEDERNKPYPYEVYENSGAGQDNGRQAAP